MEPTLQKLERERDIAWFFNLALWLKAINGALEVLVALLVLLIPPSLVLSLVEYITGGEFSQDAEDPIAAMLTSAAHSFAIHSHYLLALYLVLHGGIKIILVLGIVAKKRIAYPLFMLALLVFGSYEAYRGFLRHEILLQIIAVLDFAILFLTMYEYRQRYPSHFSLRDRQEDYAEQ